MIRKQTEVIGFQDAMENLAAIASIDMEQPPLLAVVKKTRFVLDSEEVGKERAQWLSGEGSEVILSLLDATYQSIHLHLQHLYNSPETDWDSHKMRQGIASTMDLVGESAEKMDRYLSMRLGEAYKGQVAMRDAFKALGHFYSERFAKKFEGGIEGPERWQEEWSESPIQGSDLQDFDAVRKDREYELFYIRNEMGKPYFTAELLRNLKLSVHFDGETESFEEDPLLKIRVMADRDLNAAAKQILGDCHGSMEEFYKTCRKTQGNELVQALNTAIVALFLTADPRHLIQNTEGKSALPYFQDFHSALRKAMQTSEYQKLIAYSPEKDDRAARALIQLTHHFCYAFFHRVSGVKQEAIGLIHRTMRRGEELQTKKEKGSSLWNQLLFDDEKLRTLLAKFPNGPLFKILDVIREEQEEDAVVPFDPIGQENLPSSLYEIEHKGKSILVLRIPSPTRQSIINKVEIVEEFKGFLRYSGSKNKHLIVNLQDRTSWREFSRSGAVESMQKMAEFSGHLFVLTLPKDTDFYFQNNEYLHLEKANDFLISFKAQLENFESCGFHFPLPWKLHDVQKFVAELLPLIHEHFFESKTKLSRKEREDFIEIVYQFLILKAIEICEPDSLSFTCKDAVDTGAAQSALFYIFLRILSGDLDPKIDRDFLLWLLYTPAFFVRERAIDPERFYRALSAAEGMENCGKIMKALSLKGIGVSRPEG